jgi:hypothetical protein
MPMTQFTPKEFAQILAQTVSLNHSHMLISIQIGDRGKEKSCNYENDFILFLFSANQDVELISLVHAHILEHMYFLLKALLATDLSQDVVQIFPK